MSFEEFQDGRHLGYRNWTILVILNLHVTRMPPTKFPFNPHVFRKEKLFVEFQENHYLFSCFTSQVNSYVYGGTVSSPNHTFSWAGLYKRLTSNLCTYFRSQLKTTLLEWISGREENDRWNYFMINFQVWDRAGIKLATPGSAVRHLTYWAMQPENQYGGHLGYFGTEPF